MAKQHEEQEREAKKLEKEDWHNSNHTWQGVDDKDNATVAAVLGPLMKNYIDLVPSVSGCTGALLGCHIWFYLHVFIGVFFRLPCLCICQFPGYRTQQLSSSLSGEVYYWGVWVML